MTEKKEDTSFAVKGAEALFEEALAAVEKVSDVETKAETGKAAKPAPSGKEAVKAPSSTEDDVNIIWDQADVDSDADEEEIDIEDAPVVKETALQLQQQLREVTEARDKEASERKQLYEQLQRTTAEFDNFRKRTQREKEELRRFGHKEVTSDLLDVIDNFARALETLKDADKSIREGIEMVHRQFIDILGRHGVKSFESLHEPFDYTRHQAISIFETDQLPPQMVHSVFKDGYMVHDQLLRPAMVIVSKALAPKVEAPEDPTEEVPAVDEKASASDGGADGQDLSEETLEHQPVDAANTPTSGADSSSEQDAATTSDSKS